MIRHLMTCLLGLTLSAPQLIAQERTYLGHGHLFTNDALGDTDDRWRTGSYQSSRLWGPEWTGTAPERFGQLLEFRFGGEIVTPEDIGTPTAGDRAFAGILSFGVHTHFTAGLSENSVGLDVAFTGSQTGLDDFQSALHDLLDASDLSSGVRNNQISNDVHPTLVMASARRFELSDRIELRPFVEGRLGLENLLRAGADLTFGQVGKDALMIRDTTTGHRYRMLDGGFQGAAFVVGADMAYVDDSALLPSPAKHRDQRTRVRAGMHWQTQQGFSGFYGLTWLDKEFEGQREGQVVGSLRLNFSF